MALPPTTVRRRRPLPSLSSFAAGFRPRTKSISSSNNKNVSKYDCNSKVDDVDDDIVEVERVGNGVGNGGGNDGCNGSGSGVSVLVSPPQRPSPSPHAVQSPIVNLVDNDDANNDSGNNSNNHVNNNNNNNNSNLIDILRQMHPRIKVVVFIYNLKYIVPMNYYKNFKQKNIKMI